MRETLLKLFRGATAEQQPPHTASTVDASKIQIKIAPYKRKILLASFPVVSAVALVVPAFAAGETPTFDLTTLMTTAMSKIVGDLLTMIAAVLPIAITLIAASIGIAYAIKFIRKITKA